MQSRFRKPAVAADTVGLRSRTNVRRTLFLLHTSEERKQKKQVGRAGASIAECTALSRRRAVDSLVWSQSVPKISTHLRSAGLRCYTQHSVQYNVTEFAAEAEQVSIRAITR